MYRGNPSLIKGNLKNHKMHQRKLADKLQHSQPNSSKESLHYIEYKLPKKELIWKLIVFCKKHFRDTTKIIKIRQFP